MNQIPPRIGLEEFVFAVTSVPGATAAGLIHGDLETVSLLAEYYLLVADTLGRSEGRVIKVMGDGVLIVFPIYRARDAVGDLRFLQTSATALWSAFDARCRVEVKAGAGRLASGAMGPPGAQQFDVYGKALNDLFKAPSGDFVIVSELDALLD